MKTEYVVRITYQALWH